MAYYNGYSQAPVFGVHSEYVIIDNRVEMQIYGPVERSFPPVEYFSTSLANRIPADKDGNYVECGETAPMGKWVLALQPRNNANHSGKLVVIEKLRSSDQRPTRVFLDNWQNLPAYEVGINFRMANAHLLLSKEEEERRQEFGHFYAPDVLKLETVGRTLRDIQKRDPSCIERFIARTIPHAPKMMNVLDSFLRQNIPEISKTTAWSMVKSLEGKKENPEMIEEMVGKLRSNGQVLYLILHYYASDKFISPRVLLTMIWTMNADSVAAPLLWGALVNWTVTGCCSCLEKIIIFSKDKKIIDYPYSLANWDDKAERVLKVIENPFVKYEITDHDEASVMPASFRVHEHGFIRITTLYDNIRFSLGKGQSAEIISLHHHWGMSLISLLDGAYKILKTSLFGSRRQGIKEWMVSKGIASGETKQIVSMLADLVEVALVFPPMHRICENLFGVMLFGVIPTDILCRIDVTPKKGSRLDFYKDMLDSFYSVFIREFSVIFCEMAKNGRRDEILKAFDHATIKAILEVYNI